MQVSLGSQKDSFLMQTMYLSKFIIIIFIKLIIILFFYYSTNSKNSFGYSTIKQEEKLPSISRLLSDLEKFGRIQLSHVACIYEDIKLQHTISDDDKLMLIKCCGKRKTEVNFKT